MIGEFDKKSAADKAVVIYHANCNDGFGAAWAFSKLSPYLNERTSFIPVNYGEVPPVPSDAAKCDLWVLDFSFPLPKLEELAEQYNQVIVVDHHKTFIDALAAVDAGHPELYPLPNNLTIVWDIHRSGAGLTWDYLCELYEQRAYRRPQLINYIEDRDIWTKKLKHTEEINAVISVTPKTLNAYSELSLDIGQKWGEVAQTGEMLLRQHERICDDIVKLARKVEIYDAAGNSYMGLLANCTGHFASDVGNRLAETSGTFGGTYYADADGSTKFSLRSIGDYDVSAICKSYGGGGHKNAAGFKLANARPEVDGVIIWKTPDTELPQITLPQGGM